MWSSATKCSGWSFVWMGHWHQWPVCKMIWPWNGIRQMFHQQSWRRHSPSSWLRWNRECGTTDSMIAESFTNRNCNEWLRSCTVEPAHNYQKYPKHSIWVTVPGFLHWTFTMWVWHFLFQWNLETWPWGIFYFANYGPNISERWQHQSRVGIAISGRMMKQISNISFHAYSPRLCLTHRFLFVMLLFPNFLGWRCFDWRDVRIAGFGAGRVGPDTWSHYCWRRLQRLHWRCATWWWLALLGLVGCWSQERPRCTFSKLGFAEWVSNFEPANKCAWPHDINDTWTCQRYFDETRVQLDFTLGDSKANVADVWLDNSVPIGLDHRCVHCIVTWTARRKLKKMSAKGLKHWKPYLDENGEPTQYQSKLLNIEANNYGNVNEQLLKLEGDILMAGREGGECKRLQTRFLPSDDLKQLRLQRREAENRGIKKE